MANNPPSGSYQEESPFSLLFVKVVRARNIPWADWMSNADCYVSLWLPTSTSKLFKTSTAADNSNPVWNEKFEFKITGNVKNMLELTLYDEDVISKNDLLYKVYIDVGNIGVGETLLHSFPLSPKGKEILDVEFELKKIPAHPETIVTNGVLVARELSCLDVSLDKQKIPPNLQGETLLLAVENSCEKTNKMELSSSAGPDRTETCCFHTIKKYDAQLNANIEGANTEDPTEGLKVPFNSLHRGKDVKVHLKKKPDTSLELTVKAQDCTGKLDVRLGYELCEDELDFIRKRKKVAAVALKKALNLDRDLEEHEVPVIAVTTTGGGTRAMTGLYGTLSALQKLNLLDCVFYITGASGSTWAIGNLYADPEWSQKDLKEPIEAARKNVCKDKKDAFSWTNISKHRAEMKERERMGYKTSFTDVWGLMIETMFHDDDRKTLSDQKKALNRAQNPLPLCLAMNVKRMENTTLDFKEWCEFSPYEVGLVKYGAYIRSEDFGSRFYMGKLIEKLPESRICFLQGLWSNIFSINLMDAWFFAASSENFWHPFTRDNVLDLDGEEALKKKSSSSSNLSTLVVQPTGFVSTVIRDIITCRPIDAVHHNFLKGLQIHKDYNSHQGFCYFKDTELDKFPHKLTSCSEDLCLVDSGYYINASFPPLLRKERKVDLILSFDYALSGRFQSVVQTYDYCTNQKIPFPKVNVTDENRKKPKECNLFTNAEDIEAPILLHFPLINDTFKDFKAPGVKRTADEMKGGNVLFSDTKPYGFFKVKYSDENFEKLLNLTEYNVLNNEEVILQSLRDAITQQQKRNKMGL